MPNFLEIPYGEWLPDPMELSSPGLSNDSALNAVPHLGGYKPFPSLSIFSTNGTDDFVRGAIATNDTSNIAKIFVGDESKLYELVSNAWVDRSLLGGYSNSTDDFWEFARYKNLTTGEQKVIATNFADDIQQIDVDNTGPGFSDLSASAPRARHIGIIGDFVVVGATFDATDGQVDNRVRWSALGDETDWVVSPVTQADFQDLQGDGGRVQAVISDQRSGLIFQERAVWRMTFVGPPVVFIFDRIEDSKGLIAPKGAISVSGNTYYIANNGFQVITGSRTQAIGENKVDQFFFADKIDSEDLKMHTWAHPVLPLIGWRYVGSGAVDAVPNRDIIFNLATQTWSLLDQNNQFIFSGLSVPQSMDDLVGVDLDAETFSLDSRQFTGGQRLLQGIDSDGFLGNFNGTPLNATLDTGEFQGFDERYTRINQLRILGQGGTRDAQIGSRQKLSDTVVFGSVGIENSRGAIPLIANNFYHRIRSQFTGDWSDAKGVKIYISSGGRF